MGKAASAPAVKRRFACAAVLALVAAPSFAGDIDSLTMFRNLVSVQSGDGPALADSGAFLSIGATTLGQATYTSAGVDIPVPSTLALTMPSPTSYSYQTATLPDKAAMDGEFAAGTYQVNLDDGVNPIVSASFVVGADHYARSMPYLDGGGWSSLQGMNAGAALTLPISAFSTDPGTYRSYIFFSVYDYTATQMVFDAGFLPAGTASITLPANQLMAGHDFAYELIFFSRVLVPSPGANYDAQIGYELRTQGGFAGAAPEPGAAALLPAGLLVVGARRRRG